MTIYFVVGKRTPGAPNGNSGMIIEIILDLWSKEYQICCACGVNETLRLELFKANGV